jgi:hypothetical protein
MNSLMDIYHRAHSRFWHKHKKRFLKDFFRMSPLTLYLKGLRVPGRNVCKVPGCRAWVNHRPLCKKHQGRGKWQWLAQK